MAIINHVSNNWITSHFLSHRRRLRIADSPREKNICMNMKTCYFFRWHSNGLRWWRTELRFVFSSWVNFDHWRICLFTLLIGYPLTTSHTIVQFRKTEWRIEFILSVSVCLDFYTEMKPIHQPIVKMYEIAVAWMVEIETVEIVAPFKKVQLFWLFSKKGRILKVEELELKNYENIWINNRLWETQFWFVLIFSLIFVIFALKPLY